MDVDSFVAQYRAGWQRLEAAVAGGSRGLARQPADQLPELIQLYLLASAHLAEVRTTYKDQSLERYLNGLVARAHAALYGAEARTTRGALRAFGSRYRAALRRTAPFILIAAGLTVVVTVATMLWVIHSREAQAGLLPSYARDALRHANGDRMNTTPRAGLSAEILLNNVQVSFLAFAAGITLGIGTIFVLIKNAVMLGSLAGAFASVGKGWVFWSLIVPHGLLELTAICIAAGAGMRIGWALVDPGDRSRAEALTVHSRDAVLVIVGVIPAFVVAAAIEGFITGTHSVPTWFEVSLGFVVWAGYIAFLFGGRDLTGGRAPRSQQSASFHAQVMVGQGNP